MKFNGKKTECFPPKVRNKVKDVCFNYFHSTYALEVLASVTTQEKETKDIWIGKEEVTLSIFTEDSFLKVQNLVEATKSHCTKPFV